MDINAIIYSHVRYTRQTRGKQTRLAIRLCQMLLGTDKRHQAAQEMGAGGLWSTEDGNLTAYEYTET